MKFDKHTLGKRFLKCLLNMFRHFNEAVPNHSSTNYLSIDKHVLKSDRQTTNHDRISYRTHYRKRSIRQRNSTLMSIKEENEIELMNCI